MSGKKIKQQKEAMTRILEDLHEGDRFNIMLFDSDTDFWKSRLVSSTRANVEEAKKYALSMKARGCKYEKSNKYCFSIFTESNLAMSICAILSSATKSSAAHTSHVMFAININSCDGTNRHGIQVS